MAYAKSDDSLHPNTTELPSEMLSVREAAHLLGVHINTVRRWSDSGRLPVYRIGPRSDRKFNASDIARFLKEARQAS